MGTEGCSFQGPGEPPAHRSTTCDASRYPYACDWTPLGPEPFVPGQSYPCWVPTQNLSIAYDTPYIKSMCGNPRCVKLFNPMDDFANIGSEAETYRRMGVISLSIGITVLVVSLLVCLCRQVA